MQRGHAVFNLVQAGAFAVLAAYLGPRWLPAGILAGVGCVAQLAGGVALIRGHDLKVVRWASLASLGVSLVIIGLHVQAYVHIIRTFTPVGAEQGYRFLGHLLVMLPWALFIPLGQLVASRPSKAEAGGAGAAVLIALLGPPGVALTWGADHAYAAVDGAAVAEVLYARFEGRMAAAPRGPGPVLLVAAVVCRGQVVEVRESAGDDLRSAVDAISWSSPPCDGGGIYLDVAREEGRIRGAPLLRRGFGLARPGSTALRTGEGVIPTLQAWRIPRGRTWLPGIAVPMVGLRRGPSHWIATDSWITSDAGTASVRNTWSAPPDPDAAAMVEAALAGGRHLVANMQRGGRFAYVVRGPSGDPGGGYNYPRHAGASWFLARLYRRTGDPRIHEAAHAALAFMKDRTQRTDDGRAYVLDPSREDGKAWVGTTALALMAWAELGEDRELMTRYATFVASSVDERGAVRGDLDVASGTWPDQPQVTYAQGQGLLALAAAERAGVAGVSDALDRAIRHVDGAYLPMPAGRMQTLDEHWMCLAAAAVHEQRGVAAGVDVCEAYLAGVAPEAPVAGSALQPAAGPAAGLAEAVVARAEIARRAGGPRRYHRRALDYARLLLSNQYRATDAPLLGRPDRLIGGFRDRPWSLDVRLDAVQHIGCALLGVEQLLRDEALDGAMP